MVPLKYVMTHLSRGISTCSDAFALSAAPFALPSAASFFSSSEMLLLGSFVFVLIQVLGSLDLIPVHLIHSHHYLNHTWL